MGSLDDAFAGLASLCVEQLAEPVGLIFTRDRGQGAYSPTTGTESAGSWAFPEDSTEVAAIRGRQYTKQAFGNSGSSATVRVKEFSLVKSDLASAWPGATLMKGDQVVAGGDSIKRRVVEIHSEVNDTMWRIVTETTAGK